MDQSLQMLAKDVRGKTLKILDGLTDEQSHFAAPGLNNSILWHAGHALVVVEHLAVALLTGQQPSYPAGYFETFSWKSTPATITTWPPLAEVRAQLTSQYEKVAKLLEQATDAQLSTVTDPARNRTLRYSIMHGFHDEAGHQGEMWLLKKMLTKQK